MTKSKSAGALASPTVMLRGYVQPETADYIKQVADKSGQTQGQVLDALVRARGRYHAARFARHAAFQTFVSNALLLELLRRQPVPAEDNRTANDTLAESEKAATDLYGPLDLSVTEEG